jgi:hypothetical protein
MNVEKAIADLRLQLKVVNQVIITFERLEAIRERRRGRPPKWLEETRSRLNKLPEARPLPKRQRTAILQRNCGASE